MPAGMGYRTWGIKNGRHRAGRYTIFAHVLRERLADLLETSDLGQIADQRADILRGSC